MGVTAKNVSRRRKWMHAKTVLQHILVKHKHGGGASLYMRSLSSRVCVCVCVWGKCVVKTEVFSASKLGERGAAYIFQTIRASSLSWVTQAQTFELHIFLDLCAHIADGLFEHRTNAYKVSSMRDEPHTMLHIGRQMGGCDGAMMRFYMLGAATALKHMKQKLYIYRKTYIVHVRVRC